MFAKSLPNTVLLGGQALGVCSHSAMNPFIGTLTFIEPHDGFYGALGHFLPITWFFHKKRWSIKSSSIKAIKKATQDLGFKIGELMDRGFSGTIKRNTSCGIFGDIEGFQVNPYFKDPIPVARFEEIKFGPATLYTVLEGDTVEEFDITVDSIICGHKKTPYLTIDIVDPDLIARTGGIVKGMSGSPIIQDGKLIGALSHLSARNCQRGYAVFIGSMLKQLQ
mgnify:CR=1 FL=1